MKQTCKKALQIYCFFVRIGCFTFGGGWSIVAQMQKEFVEKRKWITKEELFDFTAIGKSLPGTMIGNCSFLFGYHVGGFLCAAAAVLGIITVPLIILSVIVPFYTAICDNAVVNMVMVSVRAAVIPIMVQVAVNLFSSIPRKLYAYLIMAAAFAAYVFLGVSAVWIIVFGGLIGVLIGRREK